MWQTMTFTGTVASVRGFGTWLASARAERQSALGRSRLIEQNGQTERISPGEDFRTRILNPEERPQDQLTINTLFQTSGFYFSGELYLFDIRSQQQYTIMTDQGDSEVLLVDGNTVYYRVNDALYKATMGIKAVENSLKISSGDIVPLAHWAFLGAVLSNMNQ
jgi:hypothetical protein